MKRGLSLLLVLALLTGFACAESADSFVDQDMENIVSEAVDAPMEEIEVSLPADSSVVEDASDTPSGQVMEDGTAILAPESEAGVVIAADNEAETQANAEPAPTLLSVSKKATRTVYLGTSYQIEVPGKTVKSYKSSSKKIASVNKNGLITLKKAGKVKITIRLSKKKEFKLTLKVVDPTVPTKVVINEGKSATAHAGDVFVLTTTVSPETANQSISWKSSKPSVATVDADGVVTTLKKGKVTITATTANKKKASLALNVKKAQRPVTDQYMISHAMGGVDGKTYGNCLEAFQENYAEGFRAFEVDFQFTSDGKMVLWHDWKRAFCSGCAAGTKPTYAQFMNSRIFDRYTPMSVDDLLLLMSRYPDVRIITDTKYTSPSTIKKQFKTIVNTARTLGVSDVLKRMVVEVYSQSMYKTVNNIYHFKAYIFATYKQYKSAPTKSQLESIAAFCSDNGIDMVAMYTYWWKPEYMDILRVYDLDAGLYTTNDAAEAEMLFNQGVTSIFTDFLPPR